jgi:hypothetical protein
MQGGLTILLLLRWMTVQSEDTPIGISTILLDSSFDYYRHI